MKNKTVIVTGGAKGIGKAIALRFAKAGANIVLNYKSTEPDDVMSAIKELGANAVAVKADISVFEEAESLTKAAKEAFGSVDCLINNAGITKDGLLLRMTEGDFDSVISTNLKGAFNMIKHVTPIMLKQRSGSIINISSVVGIIGNIGQANYCSAKAGLIGLTKACAIELGSRGITCNAIAPGFIETEMTQSLSEEVKAKMLNSTSLKRFGKPSDVAELAYFLSASSFITGEVIRIDGGMSV